MHIKKRKLSQFLFLEQILMLNQGGPIMKKLFLTAALLLTTFLIPPVLYLSADEPKQEQSTIPPAPVIDEDIVILREYEIKSKRVTVYYDKKIRSICHITDAGHISCLPYQPQLWPDQSKNYIRQMLQKNRQEVKEEKGEIDEETKKE
jgi:hypothetical protein